MRARPLYYGWYDQNRQEYLVSRHPPDSPVRPALSFETAAEATSMAQRKRLEIIWWPPLSPTQMRSRPTI